MTPEEQAAKPKLVKKFESGMVVDPLIYQPEASLKDALEAHEK